MLRRESRKTADGQSAPDNERHIEENLSIAFTHLLNRVEEARHCALPGANGGEKKTLELQENILHLTRKHRNETRDEAVQAGISGGLIPFKTFIYML